MLGDVIFLAHQNRIIPSASRVSPQPPGKRLEVFDDLMLVFDPRLDVFAIWSDGEIGKDASIGGKQSQKKKKNHTFNPMMFRFFLAHLYIGLCPYSSIRKKDNIRSIFLGKI